MRKGYVKDVRAGALGQSSKLRAKHVESAFTWSLFGGGIKS